MTGTALRALAAALLILAAGCGEEASLPRLAPGDVLLAFGDSITYGTGAGEGESYPAVLQRLTGLQVVGRGVPGELSRRGLRRLSAVIAEVRPRLVILCHGGNDILRRQSMAELGENLRAMVRLIREQGAEAVMIGVPRFGLLPATAPIYLEVAEELGVVIDAEILPSILTDNALKADRVHPNAAGYERLARALQALLRQRGAI